MQKNLAKILLLLTVFFAACKEETDISIDPNSVRISVSQDGYSINSWAEKQDLLLKSIVSVSNGESNDAVTTLMAQKTGPIAEHLAKYIVPGETLRVSVNGPPELRRKVVKEIEALKKSQNQDIEITETYIRANVERLYPDEN